MADEWGDRSQPSGCSMTDYFDSESVKKGLKSKSVGGGAVQIAAKAVTTVTGLGSTAILARLLAPEDYGLKAMALSAVGFIGIFSNLGLTEAIIQRKELTSEQASSLFWLNLAFSVALILICLAVAPVAAWFYDDSRIFSVVAVASLAFFISALGNQHAALLQRNMMFRNLALGTIIHMLVGQGAAIIAAFYGWEYWAIVIGPLVGQVAFVFFMWGACSWRPSGLTWTDDVKSMLSFGANMTFSNLASYINRNADDILIGRFVGSAPLGLYNRAYALFRYPMDGVWGPVGSVAVPALSRLHGEAESYRRAFYRILEKVLLIMVPASAILAANADLVVELLLGQRWAGVAPIFMVLSVGLAYQPIGKTSGWIYVSQNRTREARVFSLWISTPINILAFSLGLYWGALGVAISYVSVGIFVLLPINLWMANRSGPISAGGILRFAMPFVFVGLATFAASMVFRSYFEATPLVEFTASLAVCAVTALACSLGLPRSRAALLDLYELVASQVRGGSS
ncbi:MAG: lipopolysaccharide biosynthesis protein [Myxococcota bacterium]